MVTHEKLNLILPTREQSPYANRVRLMWQQMREPILKQFPAAPGPPSGIDSYLKAVDDIYVTDAYHSLSIEGYRVSPELIERVIGGEWNPDENQDDREHRNVLAARGYWQAYQAVRNSVRKVLEGDNPGVVADDDHGDWYREMFGPSVTAGLLQPTDLAGYRNNPVYIRHSMHVPPRHEAAYDCMPAFFDLLREELEPSVRVVLGHFMFVYIPIHGWQWPYGTISYERNACRRWLSLDRYSARKPRLIYGCVGKRECGTGYRTLCNVSWTSHF